MITETKKSSGVQVDYIDKRFLKNEGFRPVTVGRVRAVRMTAFLRNLLLSRTSALSSSNLNTPTRWFCARAAQLETVGHDNLPSIDQVILLLCTSPG